MTHTQQAIRRSACAGVLALAVVGCDTAAPLPVGLALELADELETAGRHRDVIEALEGVEWTATADGYQVHAALARAYAEEGEVAESVDNVRRLLTLDPGRARSDVQAIARPFFARNDLAALGVDYYQRLTPDLARAWWVFANISTLAGRAGDVETAEGAAAQAERLRSRGVILIVVDTLRADHLGAYGASRPTSPNLDAWVVQGRLYESAHATSPWTLPSFGSIYTGYLPMRHRVGVNYDGTWQSLEPLSPSVKVLAEMFRREGYATGAVVNNTVLSPNWPSAAERGFDVYDFQAADSDSPRPASETVDRALELIDQWSDRPFFLVVHFFEPHMNYDPAPPFRGRFSNAYRSKLTLPISDRAGIRAGTHDLQEQDWEFIRATYDEEIAVVDEAIGRLRGGLATRGLIDRPEGTTASNPFDLLVMVTADHGEELNEHGGFEHGHALWEELLHIPLIVWGREVIPGRDAGQTSLVDIAPTLLEWAGLPPIPDADGMSLWSNLTTGGALPARNLVAEELLYGDPLSAIFRGSLKVTLDAGYRTVFVTDLDTDPDERVNLTRSHSREVADLISDLKDRRAAADGLRPDAPVDLVEPDSETLERLRSLGYIR